MGMRPCWVLSVAVVLASIPGVLPAQTPQREAQPARVRAFNEKGQPIGSAWAAPVAGGYVCPRNLLAGAARAVVETNAGQAEVVNAVLGDDPERNLMVVVTGIAPAAAMVPAAEAVGDATAMQVRCGAGAFYPVREAHLRDLPVFGSLLLGSTTHGDTIAGCPLLDGAGGWRGIVVWESPMAKPSVVVIPAEWAVALSETAERSWDAWRSLESAPGIRFRNSLLLEGLADLWRENYAGAIRSLSELIEAHPREGHAWYYRGYAKAMSGDRPGAIDDYEQAVVYDPENAEIHFSLGFSYLLLKRKLEATEQAKALDGVDAEMAGKLRALIDAMSEDDRPDADEHAPQTESPANP